MEGIKGVSLLGLVSLIESITLSFCSLTSYTKCVMGLPTIEFGLEEKEGSSFVMEIIDLSSCRRTEGLGDSFFLPNQLVVCGERNQLFCSPFPDANDNLLRWGDYSSSSSCCLFVGSNPAATQCEALFGRKLSPTFVGPRRKSCLSYQQQRCLTVTINFQSKLNFN